MLKNASCAIAILLASTSGMVSCALAQEVSSAVPVGLGSAAPTPTPDAIPEGGAPAPVASVAPDIVIPESMPDLPRNRANPFLPTLTEGERQVSDAVEKRDREIRELRSSLRNELLPSIMDEIRRQMKEELDAGAKAAIEAAAPPSSPIAGAVAAMGASGVRSAVPASGGAVSPDAVAGLVDPLLMLNGRPQALPDATFVACLNGKALYRDKTSVLFENADDTSSCR